MAGRGKVLGTIKNGKVKIRSKRQISFLEYMELPYTRYVYRKRKLVRKVRRNA
jgi:hypothetical protein